MRVRRLGATGLAVSEIGFGTWGIGGEVDGLLAYGPARDEESHAALVEARARGCTLFDTSNLYGWGHAETMLAPIAREPGVVLSTKSGYVSPAGEQDFTPDSIRRSVEASLGRLETTSVGVVLLHNPTPSDLASHEDVFATLEQLRSGRVVCAYGISARTPDEALVFARRYRPSCLQVNFNVGDLRALRNGLFDVCTAFDIGLVVRTPLAAGFLSGQLDASERFAASDHRQRFSPEMRARWTKAVRLLAPVLRQGAPDATPAQNAIRYCLSFPAVSSVIPGMMRATEVIENLGASALPPLLPEQLQAVEAIYDRVFC
jgi:aryl-alcohol dehydrogenase-like predicted oxidoreductase